MNIYNRKIPKFCMSPSQGILGDVWSKYGPKPASLRDMKTLDYMFYKIQYNIVKSPSYIRSLMRDRVTIRHKQIFILSQNNKTLE